MSAVGCHEGEIGHGRSFVSTWIASKHHPTVIEKALAGMIGQVLSNPIVVASGLVIVGVMVVAWLVATLWVFQDAAHRSDHALVRYLAAGWILASGPLLLPLSLPIYNLVRPAALSGDRELQVVEDLLGLRAERPSCFACAARIDPAWVRCPACSTWLAALCDRCERWAPRDANICPWCAWEPARPEPVALPQTAPEDLPAHPKRLGRRLRAGLAAIADLAALR